MDLKSAPGSSIIYYSSAIVEILISIEGESETETSMAITVESSTDARDKHDVPFYRCQTLEKRISKAKTGVPLNDVIRLFKEDLKTSSKVDITEIYRNDQQDAIQSAYFGNQGFSIFAVCCYDKPVGSDDLQNDNVMMVTESSYHDRLASMTCL